MEENIYNWNEVLEDDYSNYNQRSWENYLPYASFLLKHSKPGYWLDVGCGPGFFVECCNRYGIPCKGVEGNDTVLPKAKKRYKDIKIEIHDITKTFPYPDCSFSVVFCNQVLEHIPPKKTNFLLSEIFRILDDEGVAFINMPSIYNKEGRKEPSHINLMTPTDLFNNLKNSGFNYIIPTLYPKYIFGKGILSKVISGLIFFMLPFDKLSSNSAALAFKNRKNPKKTIDKKSNYHLKKLLSW